MRNQNAPLRTPFASRLIGLMSILLIWCAVKIVFVEVVVPQRTAQRGVRETAAQLAELVPAGEILYLCKLKDEGILFYYHRPARRFRWEQPLPEPSALALLIEAEWRQERDSGRFEVVEWFRDQQGDPIVLVRFLPL